MSGEFLTAIRNYERRIESLTTELQLLLEVSEDMRSHVPSHFAEKWEYVEALARARKTLAAEGERTT